MLRELGGARKRPEPAEGQGQLLPDRGWESILPRGSFLAGGEIDQGSGCTHTSLFRHIGAQPPSANGCDFYGIVYIAEYSDGFSFPLPELFWEETNKHHHHPPGWEAAPLLPLAADRQWPGLPVPCQPLQKSPVIAGAEAQNLGCLPVLIHLLL